MAEKARSAVLARQQLAHSLRKRLVNHLAAGGTTDMAEDVFEVEKDAYIDPIRADLERQLVFHEQPLLAGFSSEMPDIGDALLFEEMNVPVVLVRGGDGVVRGFLNMCMHRASKLVHSDAGVRCHVGKSLVCPFHAWRYSLEGKLAHIPGKEGFLPISDSRQNLTQVHVAEQHGLIFICQSQDHPFELADFLGSFSNELSKLDIEYLVPVQRSRIDANTNWKLALDTYGESYHFTALHHSTIGQSHFSNIAAFDSFALHWRMAFAERSLRDLVDQTESAWPEPTYSGVLYLFPNTILVIGNLADGAMCLRCFRLFPGATPGTMHCQISVLAAPEIALDDERLAQDFSYDDATSEITLEDYGVAEHAYLNLCSAPAGHRLIFGRNEPGVQHLHRVIDGLLEG